MAKKKTSTKKRAPAAVPVLPIEALIRRVRGVSVMLDSDLAELYGVETKTLNRAVSRNEERFPDDFAFRLTREEWADLKYQFGTSSSGHGGRRTPPRAFTEHGIAMLSGVLRSPEAVAVNVSIMRTFVRLRRAAAGYRELAKKLSELERQVGRHDEHIAGILDALKVLIRTPDTSKKRIGFERRKKGR